MRIALLAMLAFIGLVSTSQAAVTFSLSPNNANILQNSNTAVFDVFITSDVNVVMGGYSLNVVAGAGDGSGGVFSVGSFDYLVGDPGQSWDLLTTPGQAFSTADTGNVGGTGVGGPTLVANVATKLGSLTLNTNGVAAGTYTMSLDSLSAIQTNGNFIAGGTNGAINGGSITYNVITAVPEPTSLALLAMGGVGAVTGRRFFRRKKSAK